MEKELQAILTDYDEQIGRYEKEIDQLNASLTFCQTHKFFEEARVIGVKLEAINMLTYRFRNMHKKISELLNNQQSIT